MALSGRLKIAMKKSVNGVGAWADVSTGGLVFFKAELPDSGTSSSSLEEDGSTCRGFGLSAHPCLWIFSPHARWFRPSHITRTDKDSVSQLSLALCDKDIAWLVGAKVHAFIIFDFTLFCLSSIYIYIIFFFKQTSVVSWVHDLSLSRATHCFNQLSISICMLHRTTHRCCSEGFSSKYEFQIRPLLYVLIHASCSYSPWHVIPLGFDALFVSVCANSFLSWMFPMMLEMIAVLFREACLHSISIENGGEHFWYMHGTVLLYMSA